MANTAESGSRYLGTMPCSTSLCTREGSQCKLIGKCVRFVGGLSHPRATLKVMSRTDSFVLIDFSPSTIHAGMGVYEVFRRPLFVRWPGNPSQGYLERAPLRRNCLRVLDCACQPPRSPPGPITWWATR